MTAFVLMGQTLRVDECIEFLRRDDNRWTVVVGDLHGTSEDAFPHVSELVVMDSPLAGAGRRFRADLRRSATRWMRRGSRIGRMAETGIRRIRRLASTTRRRDDSVDPLVTPDSRWLDLHTEELLGLLEARNEQETVTEIVVFDLFDLPAALAFAERHGVPVSVR